MNGNTVKMAALAILAVVISFVLLVEPTPEAVPAAPSPPATPSSPPTKPCPGPNCPRRPAGTEVGSDWLAKIGGRLAPDGAPIQIDYPGSQHLTNKAGTDGAGLCVPTSCDNACRWASEAVLIGFRDWMTRKPGGATPSKLDAMIAALAKERAMPIPQYLNVQAVDLGLIQKATAAGHMPCITYYRSPSGRYGGQVIYHMVNVLHAQNGWYAICDNNYPGTDKIEWLSENEFLGAHVMDGRAWVVVFLRYGPPPPPFN